MTEIEEHELLQDEEPDPEQNTNAFMVKMMSNLSQNMAAMSESLKRFHDGADEETTPPAGGKKSRHTPESGITADVNDLLNEGETSGTAQTAGETDVLDEIVQSLDESEKTAEPVSEKLAKIADKAWLHKLSEDQLKEKSQQYHRPTNCSKFIALPKVNEEIWSKLPREARGKDLKFSRLQTTTSKAAYAIVKSIDLLLKLKPKVDKEVDKDLNNLIVMTSDSLQLLGHASYEISQVRRDEIKPNLNKEYGDLCSVNIPVTELLFGDELQTQLTHIRAANKIGITASKTSHTQKRHNNHANNRYNHFLYQGAPAQGRQNHKMRRHSNYNRTKRAETQTKK